jgi:hypothetical protein
MHLEGSRTPSASNALHCLSGCRQHKLQGDSQNLLRVGDRLKCLIDCNAFLPWVMHHVITAHGILSLQVVAASCVYVCLLLWAIVLGQT